MRIHSFQRPLISALPLRSQIIADPDSTKAIWLPQDGFERNAEIAGLWGELGGQLTGALADHHQGWAKAGVSIVAVGLSNAALFHRIAADMPKPGDDARVIGALCDVGEAFTTALGYPATATMFNVLSEGFGILAEVQDETVFGLGDPPPEAFRLFDSTHAELCAFQGKHL